MSFKKIVIPGFAVLLLFLSACVRSPSAVTSTPSCPDGRQTTYKTLIILDNSDKE